MTEKPNLIYMVFNTLINDSQNFKDFDRTIVEIYNVEYIHVQNSQGRTSKWRSVHPKWPNQFVS